MPYIPNQRRCELLEKTGENSLPKTTGELNFLLTIQCLDYLEHKTRGDYNYSTINDIVGALECCKQELYRRVAIPLEERKIIENGDVY